MKTLYALLLSAMGLMLLAGCASSSEPGVMTSDAAHAGLDARYTLLQSLDDPDRFTRTSAVEGVCQVMGTRGGNYYMQALTDREPAVRFAAAMAIGDCQYAPAKPRLEQLAKPRTGERDKRVFIAIAYALYRLDDPQYLKDLGELLTDTEKEVRADVAMVMSRMDEPAAIRPLKSLLVDEQDPMVQIQIVEALARLGDARSEVVLEAYTKTTFLDERLLAIPAMARMNNQRAHYVLSMLTGSDQPPRVRLAAARGLASMDKATADQYAYCVEAARDTEKFLRDSYKGLKPNPEEIPSTRTLAALALGLMKNRAAVDVLEPLLKDPSGQVRVAAAVGILRLLPAYAVPPTPTTKPATPATQPQLQAGAVAAQPAAQPQASAAQTSAAAPAPTTKPASKPKLFTAGARD